MTRILIVGLLGAQRAQIEREFGKRLRLRFMGGEENTHQLEQQARGSDVTLGMVGYLNHKHDRVIAAGLKGRRDAYRRVNGCMSGLRRVLGAMA